MQQFEIKVIFLPKLFEINPFITVEKVPTAKNADPKYPFR